MTREKRKRIKSANVPVTRSSGPMIDNNGLMSSIISTLKAGETVAVYGCVDPAPYLSKINNPVSVATSSKIVRRVGFKDHVVGYLFKPTN